MKQTFKAKLIGKGPTGSWTFLPIPFSVQEKFGSKAQVPVSGTINGHPFRNSLMPEGDGTHLMMVSKILKDGAGCANGDTVSVVMDLDVEPRKATVPAELKAALKAKPPAKASRNSPIPGSASTRSGSRAPSVRRQRRHAWPSRWSSCSRRRS